MKAPKRNHRLLSSPQFKAVYERGKKFSTPYFSAFIVPTTTEWQRFGMTATRKIGGAVLRNRCRRRLREVFRLRDRALLAGVGFDLVLNVRPSTATADYTELEAALTQTLRRFAQALTREAG